MKIVTIEDLGKGKLEWLETKYHFSFSDYYNPKRMHFGVLRVINDDIIQPQRGFDFHSHKDMEIISYVISGELAHKDSLGNGGIIKRGEVQYMSAGSGILHSEFNNNASENLRLLQIWVLPDAKGHKPFYSEFKPNWELRENKWLHLASSQSGDAPIKINQDVNFYVLSMNKGQQTSLEVSQGRQAYLVQIEGSSIVKDMVLNTSEALELKEENINLIAKEQSHYMMIEMHKHSS